MTEDERKALVDLLTTTIEDFFSGHTAGLGPKLAEAITAKLENEDFYYLPRSLGVEP